MKKINPVSLWPLWFFESINQNEKKNIKNSTLKKLAQGQIYLWDALNIYDDIMDGSSDSNKLPDANKYFRHFIEIYYCLGLPSEFYKLFNVLLENLEEANRKELKQDKLVMNKEIIDNQTNIKALTNLKSLSNKSLALCLGPLAILYLSRDKQSINKVSGLIDFFKYALAAKQLSDDAKDWLEDLESKSITYPIQLILKKAKQNKIKINLKKEPEIIYLLFCEIAPHICNQIKSLCLKARRSGKKIGLLKNSPLILNIIKPLENAVEKAAKFHSLL